MSDPSQTGYGCRTGPWSRTNQRAQNGGDIFLQHAGQRWYDGAMKRHPRPIRCTARRGFRGRGGIGWGARSLRVVLGGTNDSGGERRMQVLFP